MKKLVLSVCCWGMMSAYAQDTKKFNDTSYLQPVEVKAIRANEKAPFAKSELSKKEIAQNNLGQDLPFLLAQMPAVVVNSDAGNGVGYTGIRIRGTDASRINVTLNGIPYNDAESQGTFFVDMPDIASSTGSVQVQRGVGTSSNGAGAFGGSINLSTNDINKQPYLQFNNSYGSFNTWKNSLLFGSGILSKHFTIDGRLSRISSDGYIDRAKTNLHSFYVSTAWLSAKNSLRLNVFSGKEKTYQAWYGVAEYLLDSVRTYNPSGSEKPGEPYDNETDNYTQTHYQLFYNQEFNKNLKGNIAVFLTRGKGYYEQYKAGQELAAYGLPDYVDGGTTISSTDLVRRLWLDNYFYGSIFSLQYQRNKTQLVLGGGWNTYDGKHYGEVIWAEQAAAVPDHHRWYSLRADKKDFSLYSKWTQQLGKHWQSFADLQYRGVHYTINGFRNSPGIKINKNYNFLNPKLGITYTHNSWKAYASWALAQKEPNRDDLEAGINQQPLPERLHDLEMGIQQQRPKYSWSAGLYWMLYRDQLVLTGKINDVGAYTRTNISNSSRRGIELEGRVKLKPWMELSTNLALSRNEIRDFTEYLDDYDNGGQQTNFYKKSTLAFSPAVVGGASLLLKPMRNAGISLIGKYVSRQYLDNTGNKSRSLDPFYVQDIRLNYLIENKFFKKANILLQLNNVFGKQYEPNGYSFSYIYGGSLTTENFYFPMAGFNWMLGFTWNFNRS